jgi:uncharacterized membrane protein YGL010W
LRETFFGLFFQLQQRQQIFPQRRKGAKFQRALTSTGKQRMSNAFVANYKAKHQHPLNRLSHSIGIPLIVVSLPLFFVNWRWALALFVAGWILQFVGHLIEGNRPAFFSNPLYLLVGPLWLLRRIAAAIGLSKPA